MEAMANWRALALWGGVVGSRNCDQVTGPTI